MVGKLTCEERAEILDLMSRYAHYIDCREAKAWAGLFTENGEFIIPEVDLHLKGRDQLASWIEKDMIAPPSGKLFHSVLAQFFVKMPNGNVHGRAKTITATVAEIDGVFPVLVTGVYQDVFVNTEEGWRIAHRTGSADIPLSPEFLF